MALLQIDDPTAGPTPIGIDLGTTHSLVAYMGSMGDPVVLRDCDGEALVPSVVHYAADGSVRVGREAAARLSEAPEDTIASVKRLMGRGAADPQVRQVGPYRFTAEEGPVVRLAVAGRGEVTPVEVSAEILRHLKSEAEQELGEVGGAVITVPAYFDEAQRQATKDAGRLAGLDVLRLLNEPTAAALAYGLDSKRNGTFVVYDLGGGTFDVTLLSLDDGVFQVRATGGDSQLGGDDMDRALAQRFLAEMGVAEGQDVAPGLARHVLSAARAVKHALSERAQVEAEIERPDGAALRTTVTREAFDELVRPLVQRTGAACRRALRDAGLKPEDIDGVILVGGSTRVPCVRRYVAELFKQEPLGSIDPDLVVAMGAAVQADLLAGRGPKDDVLLLDVLPLSLGIETMGGVVEKILPRNTPIPAGAAQELTTYADNQTGFVVHVLQGEREMVEDCRSLAKFTLKGIPPMPAGMARLLVKFRVDENGMLKVEAEETTTGVSQQIAVKPSYGLTDEEVERMLVDAYEHGEEDVRARALREQQVEAERILLALRKALAEDGALLLTDPAERAHIEEAIAALEQARAGADHGLIRERIEALDRASKAFAGRRMDRSMQRALAGRDVGSLEQETAGARGIESHLPAEERDAEGG